MAKRKKKIVYGSVENQHVWFGLTKIDEWTYSIGACCQQFEKAFGRKLKDGEKIKFRLEEVK